MRKHVFLLYLGITLRIACTRFASRVSLDSFIETIPSINVPLIKERVENERRETREIPQMRAAIYTVQFDFNAENGRIVRGAAARRYQGNTSEIRRSLIRLYLSAPLQSSFYLSYSLIFSVLRLQCGFLSLSLFSLLSLSPPFYRALPFTSTVSSLHTYTRCRQDTCIVCVWYSYRFFSPPPLFLYLSLSLSLSLSLTFPPSFYFSSIGACIRPPLLLLLLSLPRMRERARGLQAIRANKAITHASHKKLQAASKVYCGKWRNLYLANDWPVFFASVIPTSLPLSRPRIRIFYRRVRIPDMRDPRDLASDAYNYALNVDVF